MLGKAQAIVKISTDRANWRSSEISLLNEAAMLLSPVICLSLHFKSPGIRCWLETKLKAFPDYRGRHEPLSPRK